ncbi:alpha/beta fold hydrolase [Kribbella sp. DT2]|uniref:alpha/beta fold hydrolase n=1 Tax=Kribbella sp. DT2 TaxID=3393427 RepID=UPI003CE7B63A
MSFPELHQPQEPSGHAPVVLLHGGNVANWMWDPQLPALKDRLVVTPHLPGFGERTSELWPGLGEVADDIVQRVRDLTGHDRFHVVGLSLGGAVALHLAARHPKAALSVLASGVPLLPVTGIPRIATRLHLALWRQAWFWKAQAAAFRLPADSRGPYVDHGLSVRKETARAMLADVHSGRIPEGLSTYDGPLLLVAGEREPRTVLRSLAAAATLVPRATTRLVPNMHHVWNIEDPDLFDTMIRDWLAEQD